MAPRRPSGRAGVPWLRVLAAVLAMSFALRVVLSATPRVPVPHAAPPAPRLAPAAPSAAAPSAPREASRSSWVYGSAAEYEALTARAPPFAAKAGWRTQCGKKMRAAVQEGGLPEATARDIASQASETGGSGAVPDPLAAGDPGALGLGPDGAVVLRKLFAGAERASLMRTVRQSFDACDVVVATVSFGGQDDVNAPTGVGDVAARTCCFVAFVDSTTLQRLGVRDRTRHNGWSLVDYGTAGMPDPRMKARVVKSLLPLHFPRAKYTLWVDSKLRLTADPLAVVGALLPPRGRQSVAVSENHVRGDVFAEAAKLKGMFRGVLSYNATYDEQRVRWLDEAVKRYRQDGFHGKGLPDSGLLARKGNAAAAKFSLLWTEELVRSPFGRDQISFPWVAWKLEGEAGVPGSVVNLFAKCWYVAAVDEVGHAVRNGVVAG